MENIKEKLIKFKSYILIISSILVTFALNIDLDKNKSLLNSFNGNSVYILILFILTYWLLKKISSIKNKRMKLCGIILAIILAIFEVIGTSLQIDLSLNEIIGSKTTLLKSFIKFVGSTIIFYGVIVGIYSEIENKKIFEKTCKYFTNNKKTFFLTWGIIFLAWIPYFLRYYPGQITADSMLQIYQSLGRLELTNHHPLIHTTIIGLFMKVGEIRNDFTSSIACFSIMQMLFLSASFSFAIYYMAKKGISKKIRVLTLIFYAFYPVNGIYSITMWKDIPFAITMLFFTIVMTEVAANKEAFFSSKKNILLLVTSMILVILFRNNGVYVVLLTLPFIFIFAKKYYKKLIIVTCVILAFYCIWKGPVFQIFNVKQGSSREALSIPLQQFARITKYYSDSLTTEEKEEIYKYLPSENLADEYIPTLSDPVKDQFNDEAFKNDKIGFIKLWLELSLKYPRASIEAFLCNNYGYWYPETVNWVVSRENLVEAEELNIKQEPIANLEIIGKYDSLIDKRDIPLSSMLYSIGFNFWIVLIMAMYVIYKRNYIQLLTYIPVLLLWLTTNASPVYAEYRYVYCMFVCLPILVGINFTENKNNN